jgi:8-oxo-dGTP diphosphatase
MSQISKYGVLALDKAKQLIVASYQFPINLSQESTSFNAFFYGHKQMCQRHGRLSFHEHHLTQLEKLVNRGAPISRMNYEDLRKNPIHCSSIYDFYSRIGYDYKHQQYLPQGVGIIALRNGKAAVNQRTQTKALQGYWQFAGGTIEKHELPQEAAQREFKEECGLDIPMERFEIIGSDLRTNPYPYLGHVVVAHLQPGENIRNTEPHKHTPWKWLTPTQISKLKMIPGTTEYLQRALATAQ